MLDKILEDKNVNLSNLQSLPNLQYWIFVLYHLNIWIQFVQTFDTSLYTTYLGNYCTCLFFTLLTYTYSSNLYSVFMAVQWFSSAFFSSFIYLACVYMNYLHLSYSYSFAIFIWILNFVVHYISSSICQQVYLVNKFTHLFIFSNL